MKTGVYYRNSDVRVEERPEPKPGDRDILVKVMACGLCGSDLLEWYRIKRAPLVLGHEPAGVIVETGKLVSSVKAGRPRFCHPPRSLQFLLPLPHRS